MIGEREVISVPSAINSVIVQMWGLKPSGDPQPGSGGYSQINLSTRLATSNEIMFLSIAKAELVLLFCAEIEKPPAKSTISATSLIIIDFILILLY